MTRKEHETMEGKKRLGTARQNKKKQARKDKGIHKTHKTSDNKNKTREDKAGSQDKAR